MNAIRWIVMMPLRNWKLSAWDGRKTPRVLTENSVKSVNYRVSLATDDLCLGRSITLFTTYDPHDDMTKSWQFAACILNGWQNKLRAPTLVSECARTIWTPHSLETLAPNLGSPMCSVILSNAGSVCTEKRNSYIFELSHEHNWETERSWKLQKIVEDTEWAENQGITRGVCVNECLWPIHVFGQERALRPALRVQDTGSSSRLARRKKECCPAMPVGVTTVCRSYILWCSGTNRRGPKCYSPYWGWLRKETSHSGCHSLRSSRWSYRWFYCLSIQQEIR